VCSTTAVSVGGGPTRAQGPATRHTAGGLSFGRSTTERASTLPLDRDSVARAPLPHAPSAFVCRDSRLRALGQRGVNGRPCSVDSYVNERPVGVQQSAWAFVAQSRAPTLRLPNL
jgi:hypothetical protein